jgi:hypothetical protein
VLFCEIEFKDRRLKDCDVIYKGEYDNTRLYLVKGVDGSSFDALAVAFNNCDRLNDIWNSKKLYVDTLFWLEAYHGTVKHLHFQPDSDEDECDDGYIYSPNISELADMLQILHKIANKMFGDDY